MRIAACQFHMVWEDSNASEARAEQYIMEAKEKKVELLLFPEMGLTGFSMNGALMEEAYKEVRQWLQLVSKQYEIAIGMGIVIETKLKPENHYVLYNGQGEEILDYGKIHLFAHSKENQVYQAGEKLDETVLNAWPIGAVICYDLRFGELFRFLSRRAHLIIVPANWPEVRREQWSTLLRARAIENQCYIIGVNCVGILNGINYVGDSQVIGPTGQVLGHLEGEEGLLVVDLEDDVEAKRKKFPINNSRRETLYQTLREQWEGKNA